MVLPSSWHRLLPWFTGIAALICFFVGMHAAIHVSNHVRQDLPDEETLPEHRDPAGVTDNSDIVWYWLASIYTPRGNRLRLRMLVSLFAGALLVAWTVTRSK